MHHFPGFEGWGEKMQRTTLQFSAVGVSSSEVRRQGNLINQDNILSQKNLKSELPIILVCTV